MVTLILLFVIETIPVRETCSFVSLTKEFTRILATKLTIFLISTEQLSMIYQTWKTIL